MFDDIPEAYRKQTAENEEEGWRCTQGDRDARRPPDLLTRDHIAGCIVREIKEGRGSPHGGVFLDISWIKQKLPNAAAHLLGDCAHWDETTLYSSSGSLRSLALPLESDQLPPH
jgi:succinate dehydrogenase/fumarate reductase flavoprotein subunit